jgi:hypothetical protein
MDRTWNKDFKGRKVFKGLKDNGHLSLAGEGRTRRFAPTIT